MFASDEYVLVWGAVTVVGVLRGLGKRLGASFVLLLAVLGHHSFVAFIRRHLARVAFSVNSFFAFSCGTELSTVPVILKSFSIL